MVREPHRGAEGDNAKFARRFIEARLTGFEKDMRICLTTPAVKGSKATAAFFPALGSCCGTIEYLAGLYYGQLDGLGFQHWDRYAKRFFAKKAYDPDRLRVLYQAFRHSIAHRGISTGIWVDRHQEVKSRRTTWQVSATSDGDAIKILENPGTLISDAPWPTPYTHRVHIRVGSLARDVVGSARSYIAELDKGGEILEKFFRCMEQLYPRK